MVVAQHNSSEENKSYFVDSDESKRVNGGAHAFKEYQKTRAHLDNVGGAEAIAKLRRAGATDRCLR
jgi:hypothetical protein